MKIEVHPLTNNPTAAWREISQTQKVIKLNVKPPKTEVANNKARIVCMSDTHSLTPHLKFDVPPGDIFIHAGDFTRCGRLKEVKEFNNWLGKLPHKYKIVIAGNHELSFDSSFTHPFETTELSADNERTRHTGVSLIDKIPDLGIPRDNLSEAVQTFNIKEQLTNCIYLEDKMVEIYGLKIYGSPWQPEFCNWAFNVPRGVQCLNKWDLIPDAVDVLITHTPPVGHGDLCCSGVRAGCVELLTTVQKRVKPKYHIFGHIHEGYGVTSDGKIIFINASTCDISYIPNNHPVVFDISLPVDATKD